MKKLFLLILSFSISTVLYSQRISPEEEQSVKQLIIDCFDDVWSDLDSTNIVKHHTQDYLLLEHGEVWNNDSIKNYMHRALQREKRPKRTNKFDFIRFEKSANSIWVAYHNYATWTMNDENTGQAHWLESAVAIKTTNGWKLQMLHSTRIQNE